MSDQQDHRPLTGRELARMGQYLSATRPLHLDQQRALLAEALWLRAELRAATVGRPEPDRRQPTEG